MPSKIRVPAVYRALKTLETISHGNRGLTNADLTRRLDVPPSSMSYLLRILEENGYVRRHPQNGRYRLGYKLLTLAKDLVASSDLRDLAIPFMKDFITGTGLTCLLAVLEHDETVFLESMIGRRYFKVRKSRGVGRWRAVKERLPLHATSTGKVFLAWQPKTQLESFLRKSSLTQYTSKTIANATRLLAEIQDVRERGYAVNKEEHILGYCCMSAPIFAVDGSVPAVISASGTIRELDYSQLEEIAVMLKQKAHQISTQLSSHDVQWVT
jgi:DNA-binding IclR family transcriptional regulator